MTINSKSHIETSANNTHHHSELLIIEDDKTIVTYARKVLGPSYKNIMDVNNGHQAIEIIMSARARIDILSDYHLTESTTGLTVAKATIEKRGEIQGQFVIASGTSQTDVIKHIESCISTGIISGYLEKPYSIKAIREIFSKK